MYCSYVTARMAGVRSGSGLRVPGPNLDLDQMSGSGRLVNLNLNLGSGLVQVQTMFKCIKVRKNNFIFSRCTTNEEGIHMYNTNTHEAAMQLASLSTLATTKAGAQIWHGTCCTHTRERDNVSVPFSMHGAFLRKYNTYCSTVRACSKEG